MDGEDMNGVRNLDTVRNREGVVLVRFSGQRR